MLDQRGIQVCTILPSVIDTPFFQHAANFSHHRVRAAPPVYPPEKVAETVVRLADRPRAEVVIGGAGKFAAVQKRLAPAVATRLTGRALHTGFLADESSPEITGALFEPMRDGMGVRGGWRHGLNNGGVPLAALGVALALPLASAAWRRSRDPLRATATG